MSSAVSQRMFGWTRPDDLKERRSRARFEKGTAAEDVVERLMAIQPNHLTAAIRCNGATGLPRRIGYTGERAGPARPATSRTPMEKRTAGILLLAATLAPVMVLGAYQMRHSQRYEWEMQDPVDDPPDANRPGEFTFARLRYRSGRRFRPALRKKLGGRFQSRRPALRNRDPPADPGGHQIRRRRDRHRQRPRVRLPLAVCGRSGPLERQPNVRASTFANSSTVAAS